jgi:hypothetical protein
MGASDTLDDRRGRQVTGLVTISSFTAAGRAFDGVCNLVTHCERALLAPNLPPIVTQDPESECRRQRSEWALTVSTVR